MKFIRSLFPTQLWPSQHNKLSSFCLLSHNHKYNKLLTLLTIQKAQHITYIRYLTAKHKNTTLCDELPEMAALDYSLITSLLLKGEIQCTVR